MSEKQLPNATRKRLPKIIEGLLEGKNYDEIAKAVGVKTRRTIERDVAAWRDSGGLELFLEREWLQMHGKIKKMDPVEAYRQLSKLLGKTIIHKVEAELTQEGPLVVKLWQPKEEEAKDAADKQ